MNLKTRESSVEWVKHKSEDFARQIVTYSCICKVLMDKHGWTAEQVAELFEETEDLWNELVENDSIQGMVNWCEETTGVSLRNEDDEI